MTSTTIIDCHEPDSSKLYFQLNYTDFDVHRFTAGISYDPYMDPYRQ